MVSRGRRIAAALALVLAATLTLAVGLGASGSGVKTAEHHPEPLVEPAEASGAIWPYTSRARDPAGRTLAINVVALGDAGAVRAVLERVPQANWTRSPYPGAPANRTAPLLDAESELVWVPARGAARWSYVRPLDDQGRWLASTYQLFDGSYLGSRDHVRAYVVPGANVTAMQIHAEYWDWFRLRHTVTSTEVPRERLDDQFRADPRVGGVEQTHLGSDGAADNDGTATLLRLASLAGAIVLVGVGRRASLPTVERDRQGALLLGATFGLYMLVRLGGIGLEGLLSGLSPKIVAGGLYPLVALGLPLVAWRVAGGARPVAAGLAASGGFGLALGIEHLVIGAPGVAIELLLHRVALVLALGAIAAGGATAAGSRRRALLAVGTVAWIAGLAIGLFGLL